MSFAATTNPVVSALTSRDTQAADQGQYFVALTPTPGTGIISGGSVQAFTETTPYLVLFNSSTTVSIYPMYLRGHITVIGAGVSTKVNWTVTLDTGNRYSSAGTALAVSNTNMASSAASAGIATVGAVVATAASGTRRIVGQYQVKHTVIEVVHDTFSFNWGGGAVQPSTSSIAANSTTPTYASFQGAPLVIGPQQSMVIVRWGDSQTTGSTSEIEMGWIEK